MNRPPLAFLQRGPGDFVIGYGPFTTAASPPPDKPAFYRNDFWLSDAKPWKVPAWVEYHDSFPLASGRPLTTTGVDWQAADREGYAAIFGEARDLLLSGQLRKTVPVMTLRGTLKSQLLSPLLDHLAGLPEALHAYGWLEGTSRFLGATPEVLLRGSGRNAETMALAGTARPSEQSRLESDPKELREHALVVSALQDRLAPFGEVRTGLRSVLDLGRMCHLHTPISLRAHRDASLPGLAPLLHPTPALGPFPRTPDSLRILRRWRERLACPDAFGAPFGFLDRGRLDVVVAIRMIEITRRQVALPVGAGLLAQSTLAAEWRELLLKADCVRALLGLTPIPAAHPRELPPAPVGDVLSPSL